MCAQAVYHESGQCFTVHIFSNNEERTAAFYCKFEHGQEFLEVGDLLVVDQDVRVLHFASHLLRIRHEISREITTIELHTLHGLEDSVATLGIFDGNHAIYRHFAHTIGNELTDFSIVVGRDSGYLFDFVVVCAHLFSLRFDAFHHFAHSLVDTTLEIERISTSSHVFHAFGENGLCEHGGSCGAITCIITRLRGYTLDELCTSVLERIF